MNPKQRIAMIMKDKQNQQAGGAIPPAPPMPKLALPTLPTVPQAAPTLPQPEDAPFARLRALLKLRR